MKSTREKDLTIDRYIASFPPKIQTVLKKVRATIRQAAPEAQEAMKYGIPTFVLHENLVHFGAFQNHLGFYPTPDGIQAFAKELASYPGAKGSVQFPFERPMPLDLIRRIVKFRVRQVTDKWKAKSTGKKRSRSSKRG